MANISVFKTYIEEERELVCKYLNDDNELKTVIGIPNHLNEREVFISGSDGLEHGVEMEKIICIETKFVFEMRKAMVIQERIDRTAKYMEQGDTPHQARLKAIADMEAINGKETHEKNV